MSSSARIPEGSETPRRSPGGLGDNPLSSDALLEETFYRSPSPLSSHSASPQAKKDKPTHYKVVSISLYTEDIARLEAMVSELKRRGFTKANRSQLIRYALDTVDLDAMPRGY